MNALNKMQELLFGSKRRIIITAVVAVLTLAVSSQKNHSPVVRLVKNLSHVPGSSHANQPVQNTVRLEQRFNAAPANAVEGAALMSKDLASDNESSYSSSPLPTESPRRKIQTANINVEVTDFRKGYEALLQIARSFGAEVELASVQGVDGAGSSGTITFTVDPNRLDDMIGQIATLGKLRNQYSEAQDVSDAYVDLEARLTSARRIKERLIQILDTRTGRLGDVLQVENQIARVDETIETIEARLRLMNHQTANARLQVTMYETSPIVTPSTNHRFLRELRAAASQAMDVFLGMLRLLIVLAGFAGGGAVYAGLGYALYVAARKLIHAAHEHA